MLKISHITERSLSAKNATLAQIFLFGFERLLPVLISNSVSTICPEVQPFVATCRGLFSLEVKTCPRVGVHRVAPVDSQRPVLRYIYIYIIYDEMINRWWIWGAIFRQTLISKDATEACNTGCDTWLRKNDWAFL